MLLVPPITFRQREMSCLMATRNGQPRTNVRLITRDRAAQLQGQAHRAFLGDLADLLQTHLGQWVAYRGKTRLCIESGKTGLLQKCLGKGIEPKELLVRKIHPGAGEPPSLFISDL